jgi:hypothetical protein
MASSIAGVHVKSRANARSVYIYFLEFYGCHGLFDVSVEREQTDQADKTVAAAVLAPAAQLLQGPILQISIAAENFLG